MKAKARIAAMFTVTVITPLQRCLELARPCGVAINAKQTIAIAVKYPMRSAAIVISSPPVWNDAAGTGEKLYPTSHQRLGEKWNYSRPTSGNPPHRQCGCALSKSGNLAKFTAILRA